MSGEIVGRGKEISRGDAEARREREEILRPSRDVRTFLQRLYALHIDAKKVHWGDDHVARMNAAALCAMITQDIQGD